jgi:hypothetical protein
MHGTPPPQQIGGAAVKKLFRNYIQKRYQSSRQQAQNKTMQATYPPFHLTAANVLAWQTAGFLRRQSEQAGGATS